MKTYLRALSICYLIGAALHLADILDLRLKYSEMDGIWRSWILFLFLADVAAGFGLWRGRVWGIGLFFVIAGSQLAAHTLFTQFFGEQWFLVIFHLVTIAGFVAIKLFAKNRAGRSTKLLLSVCRCRRISLLLCNHDRPPMPLKFKQPSTP